RILELACGTGIVTRHLARALPPGAALTATDLNQAMLDLARPTVESSGGGASERVTYRTADAGSLPFPDRSCAARTLALPPRRRLLSPLPRPVLRRHRLPVRRHVLPRQAPRHAGSPP